MWDDKRRLPPPFFVPQNLLFTRLSDLLQECPFNARRVSLNALQFSEKRGITTLFSAFFNFPETLKTL